MEKITILALHLGYGGVEKSIASLSNILVDKYEVEIISVYRLYDKPAFEIDRRVKIIYLLDNRLSPNKEEFKEAIKSKNIINIFKEGIKSIKILKLKKSKMIKAIKNIDSGIVISTRVEHNELLSRFGKENIIKIAQEHTHHNNDKLFVKRLIDSCNNIDYLMPVSRELTEFYNNELKDKKTKCIYIPHSLDYIPKETSSLEYKTIISVGRLSKEKGYDDLIDIFKFVIEKKPDWKLNIIGDGDQRGILEDKIDEKNLSSSVILHGYRDKKYIESMLLKSSIYAMASHEESFGIVLIEAQSFGVPCIAFDSAKGALEIIENNINGYLIENRDKQEMANKLIELIENKELRDSMGKESKKNSYKFSKENISIQWFDFLERF
ncbi:glycosyltransferase family 4 protein [Paraclostridium sordellii]|uniref:glycosyltransferase family 4 protein n=1 Tax=Paraclostridium sordellii TaxID=1505 RepID=UPI0005DAC953|nr:glycosyltransferase family 4 protein [Paeniclostridium sordellii]CEP81551.1 group 1 glycosyl transferase [[Clostridium] sordellii] [Paeniclostridium sordellii]